MANIDVEAPLEGFREFLIYSTCISFMPESYMRDPEVFPEREGEHGSIYVEAVDKSSLTKMRDITFVNAREVLGIIYESKSGNTKLKWRMTADDNGRVVGVASANALTNLINARVVSQDYVREALEKMSEQPS
ncbi:MAG: hypothetical protein JRN39_04150 [Nitrososphaerota archaeon]|nr:hypothetical protein [Nitrososphaerota archaeon]MDG6939576.1 hypothetical protein [Nitrososphaerota archaeon]